MIQHSAPTSFERQFKRELPHLYKYFQEAPVDKVQHKLLLFVAALVPDVLLIYHMHPDKYVLYLFYPTKEGHLMFFFCSQIK